MIVTLQGGDAGTTSSNLNGVYEFLDLSPGNYVLTAEKQDQASNGVSTLDLILIYQHMLGNIPITDPYLLLAADVDHSGFISTLDLIMIRRMILGLVDQWPGGSTWFFVDANYEFTDPSNPWPEFEAATQIVVNDLVTCTYDADFVGYKIGDMNSTAKLSKSGLGDWPLSVLEQQLVPGQRYEVVVKGNQLGELSGFQFDLNVDPLAVEIVDIREGLLTADYLNEGRLREGRVLVSWNQTKLPVTGDADLFTLVLRAKEHTTLSRVLEIREDGMRSEAYDESRRRRPIVLDLEAQRTPGLELYQNVPNPFVDRTWIRFHLPQAGHVVLRISDINGRTVYQTAGDFPAGDQQFEVAGDAIPSGVFYYTVQTDRERQTRKMVRTR